MNKKTYSKLNTSLSLGEGLRRVLQPTSKGCCLLKSINDNLSQSCPREWWSIWAEVIYKLCLFFVCYCRPSSEIASCVRTVDICPPHLVQPCWVAWNTISIGTRWDSNRGSYNRQPLALPSEIPCFGNSDYICKVFSVPLACLFLSCGKAIWCS